jgi:hypothetical protein
MLLAHHAPQTLTEKASPTEETSELGTVKDAWQAKHGAFFSKPGGSGRSSPP